MLTPGKADFIEWNGETLIRRDGSTGKPIWDAARPARPWSPERDPVAAMRRLSHFGDEKRPGELVQPAPDLDGDGTGDLVWAIRGTPSLLASVGQGWVAALDILGRSRRAATPRSAEDVPRPGRIVGAPATVDVDGDGTTDLIAEFVVLDDPQGLVTPPSRNGPDGVRQPRRTLAAVASSWPCRAGRERSFGITRSTGNPRTCRVRASTMGSPTSPSRNGRSWPWSMDRSGSASTRRPAGVTARRSIWASRRFDQSSTRTSTATASWRFLLSSAARTAWSP